MIFEHFNIKIESVKNIKQLTSIIHITPQYLIFCLSYALLCWLKTKGEMKGDNTYRAPSYPYVNFCIYSRHEDILIFFETFTVC